MKENIHPDYHKIKVVMTDGTEYETRSCWGKEGAVLKLDVDPLTHPAWTGSAGKVSDSGRVAKFKDKYAGFAAFGDKKEAAK